MNKTQIGSVYKKVGIASLIMMSSVLLSRFMGLLREITIAYAGGVKSQVDAYQLAFLLPELLNHAVATGFLSVVFIPIFSQYLAKGQEEEGWRVFSQIFTSFGSILLVLIVTACLWTDFLVGLVAPGLHDPETKALVVRMTRIVVPAQFFFFAGGLLMAVQFSKEHFFCLHWRPSFIISASFWEVFCSDPGSGLKVFPGVCWPGLWWEILPFNGSGQGGSA